MPPPKPDPVLPLTVQRETVARTPVTLRTGPVLSLMVLSVSVALPATSIPPANALPRLLPTVLRVSVRLTPEATSIPPPPELAVFRATRLLLTVTLPPSKGPVAATPPPSPDALLPVTVQLRTTTCAPS